jgi:hypothetical protein
LAAVFAGAAAAGAVVSAKTKLEVADKNNAAKAIANNFFMVFLLKILGGSKITYVLPRLIGRKGGIKSCKERAGKKGMKT